jgi:uncharacterized tellurite resistance protein B-like protein
MMTPLENLYYAIGELAYSIARVDGKVQNEERERFHDIVVTELGRKNSNIDVSDIIFQLIDKKSHADSETTYNWALNEIRLNGHYLSPELKTKFIKVLNRIAEAYPPVTPEEEALIERFRRDIMPIQGDPVYYKSS